MPICDCRLESLFLLVGCYRYWSPIQLYLLWLKLLQWWHCKRQRLPWGTGWKVKTSESQMAKTFFFCLVFSVSSLGVFFMSLWSKTLTSNGWNTQHTLLKHSREWRAICGLNTQTHTEQRKVWWIGWKEAREND